MRRFNLKLVFGSDQKQALRIRRFLLAAGTSFIVLFLFAVCYAKGLLDLAVLIQAGSIIFALVVVFYVLMRSGLNQRFRDPSLTSWQIAAASLTIIYVMYHADRTREVLLMVYLMPFLFGVFRLDTQKLLSLALFVLIAYTGMIALSAYTKPATVDAVTEVTRFAVLATVLPWFAVMGGYIQELRKRLHQSNLRLQAAVDKIQDIALRDELTGVYNRRYLIEALRQEKARAERTDARLAVCLFDVDNFKQVNDQFGHAAGDSVLRVFASVGLQGLRGGDVFGRFGGEEFLLLLPQTTVEGAVASAERIRTRIEQIVFPELPEDTRVTVTVGVAFMETGEDISQVLRRADQALYRGKAAGRNRVVFGALDETTRR